MSIDIYNILSDINIPIGKSIRLDCPNCTGTNTLSITRFIDCYKYYCFHSDCSRGGVLKDGLNAKSFESISIQKEQPVGLEIDKQYWRRDNFPTHVHDYLIKNHCVSAWMERKADIRYDYKRDRVVFVIRDKNKIVDAAGRYLGSMSSIPKWYRYSNSDTPYICGDSSVAVLVEDCASATAVSSCITGVAALGTSLTDGTISRLSNYKKVFVALDKDATNKSIDMIQRLMWSVDEVDMVVLERDLKHLDETEVRKVFKLDDR